MINYKPRGRLVLLEKKTIEQIRGIILPGQSNEYRLLVAAVGPKVKDLQPGDEVEINPKGNCVTVGERGDMALCHEMDVLCLIERNDG